jgi:hypothetical protein
LTLVPAFHPGRPSTAKTLTEVVTCPVEGSCTRRVIFRFLEKPEKSSSSVH